MSTAYRYLPEGIDVLAAAAPRLRGALRAARAAGHAPVHLDGTLIRTDRCRAPGPTGGAARWWSGQHRAHGGTVPGVTAPDGWPRWTCQVRPGRAHHTAGARAHHGLCDTLPEWTDPRHAVGADLG